jgi:hypothetical protein
VADDGDLARVVQAWDGLPGPIKAAILAMIKASAPTGKTSEGP